MESPWNLSVREVERRDEDLISSFTTRSWGSFIIAPIARMQYGDENLKAKIQNYFVENHQSSLRIRSFNFFVKVLSCVLYCIQVIWNEGDLPEHVHHRLVLQSRSLSYLIWTNRSYTIWTFQVAVAAASMLCTIGIFYITYKGSLFRLFTYGHFLVELLTGMPLILSIYFPILRDLNLPIFLNSWIANGLLQDMLHDIHRVSPVRHAVLSRELTALFSTLICLCFIGACGMESLQRGDDSKFDLFTSLYFVTATLSTVGYGDASGQLKTTHSLSFVQITPNQWYSRLYVMCLIAAGICVLPKKIEALTQTWMEREKAGFDQTKGFSLNSKHIVVTIPYLDPSFVSDFLVEFYAHRKHQAYMVVLLSPQDLNIEMRNLLRIPLWSDRVIFVRGTALRDEDLDRVNLTTASACFILSARNIAGIQKKESDQQTILRSWAVKDHSPEVPQYVQVFRSETKMHIEHAELVICEDEFKYSLLANNCICPGISTFITLLMHTSQGEEGQNSSEPWHHTYGFHSGNEIYDILVRDSRFFGEYVGKTFTYASFHAHRSFGICLVGVKSDDRRSRIQLNPGHSHVVQSSDRFYYIALTNEESLSEFRKMKQKTNMASTIANIGTDRLLLSSCFAEEGKSKWKRKRRLLRKSKAQTTSDVESLMKVQRKPTCADRKCSIDAVTGNLPSSSEEEEMECRICEGIGCVADQVVQNYPPVNVYLGANATLCHVLKEKKPLCCLQLLERCEHCTYTTASEYKFRTRPIIVAADKTSAGLYNLLLPLRSFHLPVHNIQPIILLLQLDHRAAPKESFLEVICQFPDIYWLRGKISNLDNLLKAGVNSAEHVIVVKEASTDSEVQLADCGTIITVQKIHKMFPKLKITTELVTESNMRFMEFDANDQFALQQSKFEKKERKRGSSLAFMFRLPFASGSVFSAHMLDRLLYQSFLKPYLTQFMKILLGIDNSAGSGYLTSLEITEEDLWIRTYGRLYQKLCSSVADIPIGIYRTIQPPLRQAVTIEVEDVDDEHPTAELRERRLRFHRNSEGHVHEMVKQRMQRFHLNVQQYKEQLEQKRAISYVIINPSFDLELQAGDLIYVIRAPVAEHAKRRRIDPRIGLRRRSASEKGVADQTPLLARFKGNESDQNSTFQQSAEETN
ncbi:Potassium channel subfamily T member 1 [Aphelenchoides fujianensis]|nr:Potassium channel subfamily T member 1 [Aphelenchoides fujianensis]